MKRSAEPSGLDLVVQEASLEELLDLMTDGVCVVDAEARIVSWNEAAAQITGFERGAALGRTPEFLEGIGCLGFSKLVELVEQQDPEVTELKGMECTVRSALGGPVRLYGNARLLRDPRGSVLGAIACFMDLSPLDAVVEQAKLLASDLDAERGFGRLTGRSEAMRSAFQWIRRAAASDATVLVEGESGVGKELAARTIHEQSRRREGPFVAVHCSALPDALLESELFGHARGAFTGAVSEQKGRFELADSGTLFLDEIGELTPWIQVKLLRVLESREIERVGEGRPRAVDVRIIAATHRDLQALVASGQMREDFYYRIRVLPLRIPPLRERREDIPALARELLQRICERSGCEVRGLTAPALAALSAAPWRGNVRELRNVLEYASVVAEGRRIDVEHLPPHTLVDLSMAQTSEGAEEDVGHGQRLLAVTDAAIRDALAQSGGKVGQAAKRLGISRVTLWRRLRKP